MVTNNFFDMPYNGSYTGPTGINRTVEWFSYNQGPVGCFTNMTTGCLAIAGKAGSLGPETTASIDVQSGPCLVSRLCSSTCFLRGFR